MTIVIDTRERTPYTFSMFEGGNVEIVRQKLDAGDYSLVGHEHDIAIERKTHADAYGCLGRGRKRFHREIDRLITYKYAAIIIECSLQTFLEPPPHSTLSPSAAINTLISWDLRFGVRAIFAGTRGLAETYVFRMLQKFNDHHSEETLARRSDETSPEGTGTCQPRGKNTSSRSSRG